MHEALANYLDAIIVLLLLSFILGQLARKLGIAPMVGQVLAGVILGPVTILLSGSFGLDWGIDPNDPMEVFADFGILVLMLYTGLTTDFHTFRQVKRASIVVGIAGVAVTFTLVFIALLSIGVSINTALFIAALLSNTAIEVSAGVLMKFGGSRIKSVIIGASFVDDIIAVVLLGIVSSLIFAGRTDVTAIALIGLEVIMFLIVSLVVLAWMIDKVLERINRKSEGTLLMATLITGLSFAFLASKLGLHPVIGAYVAGFVVGRWGSKPDPMLGHSLARRKIIDEIEAPLNAFFAPLFFGYMGLLFVAPGGTNITYIAGLVGLLLTLSIIGKLFGAGIGAMLAGFNQKDSIVIGLAMGGRGALEIVLVRYGFNSHVISSEQFTAIMIVTLLTVILTPIFFGRTASVEE